MSKKLFILCLLILFSGCLEDHSKAIEGLVQNPEEFAYLRRAAMQHSKDTCIRCLNGARCKEAPRQFLGLVKENSVAKDLYEEWLLLYLEEGKKPTHFYTYKMTQWDWYVAVENTEIPPLFGASSINVICMPEVTDMKGEPSHNEVYVFGKNNTYVPIFGDLNKSILEHPNVAPLVRKQKLEDAKMRDLTYE